MAKTETIEVSMTTKQKLSVAVGVLSLLAFLNYQILGDLARLQINSWKRC